MAEVLKGREVRHCVYFRCTKCNRDLNPVLDRYGELDMPLFCPFCGKTEGNIVTKVRRINHNDCPVCATPLTLNLRPKYA